MAATRRQQEKTQSFTPMSEEECAAVVGYVYCPRNIRSPEVIDAQERDIHNNHNLINGFASPCNCQLINHQKCATSECPNRDRRVTCPPTCHKRCQNSPWQNRTFVAGKKTCVRRTTYGWGLFSTTKIQKGTFIGEYTGIVSLDGDFDDEDASYLFNIPPKGYVIQAYKQGSMVRCVNHSCDPNCKSVTYVDENEYKIAFYAVTSIPPKTELTIDYFWKLQEGETPKQCKCGTAKCTGIIGTIIPKPKSKGRRRKTKQNKVRVRRAVTSPPPEPSPCRLPAFASIIEGSTAQLKEVLTMTPKPQERPDTYGENHIFRSAEPAYIITQYNGRLGIVQGRITECYINDHNITFYVVDVRSPTTMQYHMPQYLCFHYPEDAAYVLQHHISEEERNLILGYFTPYASRKVANELEDMLPAEYSQMVIDGTLPATRLKRRNFPGPVAIGLPPSQLLQCGSDDVLEGEPGGACHNQLSPQPQVGCGPKQISGMTVEQLNLHAAGYNSSDSTTSQNKGDRAPINSLPNRALIIESANEYDPFYRRSFDTTRDALHNLSLMRRNQESAKENVTWFTISRTPSNTLIDYNHLYRQVSAVLEYYYTDARPNQRRFISMSHFNTANETNRTRSTLEYFCSFCMEKFHGEETLRYHFHQFHSMVAIYKCPMCDKRFSLPSMFRIHIFTCDPTFGLSFILNVNIPMVDALADYFASRTINNAPIFVIRPGLINFTRQPGNFRIQNTYENILADWPYHSHVDNAQNPRYEQSDQQGHPPQRHLREAVPDPTFVRHVTEPHQGSSSPVPKSQREPSRRRDIILHSAKENCEQEEAYHGLDNGEEIQPVSSIRKNEQQKSKKPNKRSRQDRRMENPDTDVEEGGEEIDQEGQRPCSGNIHTMVEKRRTKKRARQVRCVENPDAAGDEDEAVVDQQFQRPCSANSLQRRAKKITMKRYRQVRCNEKPDSGDQSCTHSAQNPEIAEARQQVSSNTARKTVRPVRPDTVSSRQKTTNESDPRVLSSEISERVTRADLAKRAGIHKPKYHEPELSWMVEPSSESDDNDCTYQPHIRKCHK